MTVVEQWIVETVKNLVRDMRKENEPDWADTCARTPEERTRYAADFESSWDEMELRAAILLLQARAKEARTIEAMLMINNLAAVVELMRLSDPGQVQFAKGVLNVVASQCRNRSRDLEAIGLELAKPGAWPIREKAEPEAPRLEIVK